MPDNQKLEGLARKFDNLAHEFNDDGENKVDFAVSAAYANAARLVRRAMKEE